MSISQYEIAQQHGDYGETIATAAFGVTVAPNALIDLTTPTGEPVEVKTCARYVNTGHTSSGRRRGRFNFTTEQHEYLRKNGGYYFLVVVEGKRICQLACLPASSIYHPSLSAGCVERVPIVWTRFFGDEAK